MHGPKNRLQRRAYLAGLFDGEGSISIHVLRKRKLGGFYLTLSCTIWMQSFDAIRRFQREFPTYMRGSPKRKLYSLVWYGPRAAVVLRALLPWLATKRQQALAAVRFQSRRSAMRAHRNEWPRFRQYREMEVRRDVRALKQLRKLKRRDARAFSVKRVNSVNARLTLSPQSIGQLRGHTEPSRPKGIQ